MKEQLKTPILFIIFNRPDYAKKVFDAIKNARPTKLFIAADGPRHHKPQDQELCKQTRAIANLIDWECEVKTLFQDQNLGCGKGVSKAIDWFFDHVEQGIILEDDCVPHESFFPFCAELLEKYKNDENIMMISGTSYLFNKETSAYSYFFSRYFAIWGWATWKRAWKKFDFNIPDWRIKKHPLSLFKIFKNIQITKFWTDYFDEIKKQKIDTWDIQWVYACILNHGVAITPLHNLISNIGAEGTHANGQPSPFTNMKILPLDKIIHPPTIKINKQFEHKLYKNINVLKPFSLKYFIKKTILFPYRIFKKIIKKYVIIYFKKN